MGKCRVYFNASPYFFYYFMLKYWAIFLPAGVSRRHKRPGVNGLQTIRFTADGADIMEAVRPVSWHRFIVDVADVF